MNSIVGEGVTLPERPLSPSLLKRGMGYEVVMSFTGHKSFKTMKKYIAFNE